MLFFSFFPPQPLTDGKTLLSSLAAQNQGAGLISHVLVSLYQRRGKLSAEELALLGGRRQGCWLPIGPGTVGGAEGGHLGVYVMGRVVSDWSTPGG